MRTGAAISVAAHVAALTACLVLAGVRPFDPTNAEAISVDIVRPEEAPPLSNEPAPYVSPTLSDKFEEPASQESSQSSAQQQAQPAATPSDAEKPKQNSQQAALKQQPAEPAKAAEQPQSRVQRQPRDQSQAEVHTAAPDITSKFGMMFSLPDAGATGDFDAKATATANISVEDAAALRAHLKSCAILPRSISPADNVSIILRVAFHPDGKLAAEPLLIEASASEKGPALMHSAMEALNKCQPYNMLPADRYDQWRMLDLRFSPKDFRAG